MFDKKEYQEMFSRVTASQDTYRRVMTMSRTKRKNGAPLMRAALVAALIAMLAITVSASERVQNWFVSFFAENMDGQLSQAQVEYIEEKAKPVLDSQTHEGWTVELLSAMNDNSTGYIVLGITGPEGVDMTPYIFGNQGVRGHFEGLPDMLEFPEELRYFSWGWTWVEDEDGKANTRNLVIHINPNTKNSGVKPFGEDRVFKLQMINLVREYEDENVRRNLAGSRQKESFSSLSPEETLLVYQHEIIAEGTWEFEVKFESAGTDETVVQLLSQPVSTKASFMQDIPGGGIDDFEYVLKDVLLSGIEMDHLTVSFTFANGEGMPDLILKLEDELVYPHVIMKDGSRIRLIPYGSDGSSTRNLLAEAPLVYEEIDHILMADGTVIPMPEMSK